MGCKPSKNSDSLPKIDSNFANTTNFDLDVFFLKASQLLQRIETLRHKIFVTKQTGSALAGTTNVRVDRYQKAVEVLFWSLSAAKQGDISKNNLAITEHLPYISVDMAGIPKETADLLITLQEYMSILNETPENIKDMVTQLQGLRDELAEVRTMGGKLPPKGVKVLYDNTRKLTDGFATSAKVLSRVPEEQASALQLILYMRTLYTTANVVGAPAFAAGLAKPAEIFKWTEAENKKAAKRDASVGKGKKGPNDNNTNQEKVEEKGEVAHVVNPSDVNVQTKPMESSTVHQVGAVNAQNESQKTAANNNGVMMQNNGAVWQGNTGNTGNAGNTGNTGNTANTGNMTQSFGNKNNNEGKSLVAVLEQNEKGEGNKGQVNEKSGIKAQQTGPVGSIDDTSSVLIKEGNQSEKKEKLLQNQNSNQKGNGNLAGSASKVSKRIETHGEENIDDEIIFHASANDSVMIKHFIEKAHSYLELKD